MTGHPITEDDLHGYVDGLIDGTRRAEVAAYLQDQPDVAARTASYAKRRPARGFGTDCGRVCKNDRNGEIAELAGSGS